MLKEKKAKAIEACVENLVRKTPEMIQDQQISRFLGFYGRLQDLDCKLEKNNDIMKKFVANFASFGLSHLENCCDVRELMQEFYGAKPSGEESKISSSKSDIDREILNRRISLLQSTTIEIFKESKHLKIIDSPKKLPIKL